MAGYQVSNVFGQDSIADRVLQASKQRQREEYAAALRAQLAEREAQKAAQLRAARAGRPQELAEGPAPDLAFQASRRRPGNGPAPAPPPWQVPEHAQPRREPPQAPPALAEPVPPAYR